MPKSRDRLGRRAEGGLARLVHRLLVALEHVEHERAEVVLVAEALRLERLQRRTRGCMYLG